MGFPPGMLLNTIAFGIPLTATGKDVVTTVSVKPTARVIWAATGQPLPEFTDSFTAEAGQLGQFQVPATDQPGFIDSSGNAVTDWAYQITASWQYGNERPIPWSKNLKPLMAQSGTIDLDLVPDGPVTIPVTAPTAAVLGFGGRTGFITLQESDLPDRLSPGELSATILAQVVPATVGKLDRAEAPPLITETGVKASYKTWFDKSRRGLFVHYVFGGVGAPVRTIKRDGTNPASLDDLANSFDVPRFANEMQAFGVDYVIFTAWHYAMYALYPSAVLNATLTGHATTTRDLLGEIIAALKSKGIKTVLYVHPTDGMDLTAGEQTATGWNDATGGYATWNNFINSLITECGNRYGTDLDGFWVDMLQDAAFSTRFPDKARFRRSLKAGNPARVLIGNRGTSDTANLDYTSSPLWAGVVEHTTHEYIGWPSTTTALGSQNSNASVIGGDWMAVWPQASGNVNSRSINDMFRYLVLNAGVNKYGGGMIYAAGPYAGAGATSMWEPVVESQLLGIAALVTPIKKTLSNVVPSASFPTANTVSLSTLGTPGFVAVRAADEQVEYIHVVTPPASGKTITLPAPVDGAEFYAGTNFRTGNPVTVTPTASGIDITLAATDSWDALDTVIKLSRVMNHAERVWIGASSFGSANGATFGSQAISGRYSGYSLGPTTNSQIETTFSVPQHWNSFILSLVMGQAAGTGDAVLDITEASAVIGGATNVDGQSWGQSWTMPGSATTTGALSPFTPITSRPYEVRHLRIARNAATGGDTGPTLIFVGMWAKRVS